MKKKCPHCESERIKYVRYMGVEMLLCEKCGYDERDKYEVYPSEKKSQKAKGTYSPYRTGGGRRTQKKG